MSKKKKNQMLNSDSTPSEMPDESEIVNAEDFVKLNLEPVLKSLPKKKITHKKVAPRSLGKDGKSKRLVLPNQTKPKPKNLKELAISFSKGLTRGLSQLRVINKGK